MFFLLNCHPSQDCDLDCDYARVEISPQRALCLSTLRWVFTKASEMSKVHPEPAGDLWEMYYWDPSVSFISAQDLRRFDDRAKGWEVELSKRGFKAFDGEEAETLGTLETQKTEVEQLIVRENELAWTAMVKYTDIYVTTEPLPWVEIAAIFAQKKVSGSE